MAGELILVVDDEELIRRQAEAALVYSGYRVVAAANGHEALTLLETNPPDLILSDIRMPDLDGLQLFSRGRKIRPDLVGVFMTAHSSIDIIIRAMQLGISGFLIKPFTGSELEMAIENALEKNRNVQEAARMRVLAPLFEARRYLTSEVDLPALGQSLAEVVAQETKSDYCAIYLSTDLSSESEETNLKPIAAYVGPEANAFLPRSFPAARVAARTLELGRTLILRRATDQLAGSTEAVPGMVIGVPFLVEGRALGTLLVGRVDVGQPFSSGEREVFEVLAAQLATLIENRRLHAILTERNERLRLFAGHFVSAHEEENRKLAERIQAELLPTLITTRQAIQSYLQKARPSSANDLLQAEERLHNLITNVKKLTQELRPSNLDEFGLVAALRQSVRDRQEKADPQCRPVFRLEGEEAPRLEAGVETALFRATQDAIDNACKHSASSEINVVVKVSGPRNRPDLLEIEVSDAGQGFDLLALEAEQPSARLGLMAMQERVTLVGATCEIKSAPGQGTTVSLSYKIPASLYPMPEVP